MGDHGMGDHFMGDHFRGDHFMGDHGAEGPREGHDGGWWGQVGRWNRSCRCLQRREVLLDGGQDLVGGLVLQQTLLDLHQLPWVVVLVQAYIHGSKPAVGHPFVPHDEFYTCNGFGATSFCCSCSRTTDTQQLNIVSDVFDFNMFPPPYLCKQQSVEMTSAQWWPLR